MILETERLILRPPELSDAPAIQVLAGDYEIARNTLTMPHPYPDGAAEAFVEGIHEHPVNVIFGIVRRDDQQFMGVLGIHPDRTHQHAELGYWLGKPYWNRGYMSEAARRLIDYGFAELKLHRIYASYFTHNPASRRVMEKAGMTYEGMMRQHYKRFDAFQDVGYCGILRSEWEKWEARQA